ncbi:hypothetical protein [Novosphingobium sp. BL-52-GroH]|uniref:hypothetical protein n=1 Tax=Novosphingobium sp. BL-52-GroH TaxID=3349877 RepID=UPI00384F259F
MSTIERLREATEDDVRQALEETALYGFPQDETDLLRLFKAIVDVVLGARRNPES